MAAGPEHIRRCRALRLYAAISNLLGNAILLWVRIRAEEAAMGPRYALEFGWRLAIGAESSAARSAPRILQRQRPPHHGLKRAAVKRSKRPG
jgi:hypothetical protein